MDKNKKKYDLHTHTTYSDGTFTVKELLLRAKYLGLFGIAITDHDTMEGISEGKEIAKELELDFIPGVEFSCGLNGMEIHILGYFLDENSQKLKVKFLELQKIREERNKKIISALNRLGLKISMEEVEEETTGSIVSRAHICSVMLRKGYVNSKGDAFKQYLGRRGVAYIEKGYSNPIEIIKLIKSCGGVSALAHPHLISDSQEKIDKLIDELVEAGLEGIEVEYSSFKPLHKKYYKELAKSKGLFTIGGSDFHGKNRSGVDIGDAFVEKTDIEEFLKKGRVKK